MWDLLPRKICVVERKKQQIILLSKSWQWGTKIMDKYFYCVPIGETARDLFCNKLKAVKYHESMLIVPSRMLVNKVQKNGVKAGVFDTLLKDILELGNFGKIKPLDRDTLKLMIKDILQNENQYPYFAQLKKDKDDLLADKVGLVESIYGIFMEARRQGVALDALKGFDAEQFQDDLRKHRGEEICNIFKALQAKCEEQQVNFMDLDERYAKAIELLQNEEIAHKFAYKVLAFCDFYEFDALQLKLITQLKKIGIRLYVGLNYETDARPELYNSTRDNYNSLLELFGEAEAVELEKAGEGKLAFLRKHFNVRFTDDKCPIYHDDDSLKLLSFINREQEIRWVLADIKDKVTKGAELEHFVVAVRNLDQYSGLRAIADEYGIPINRALTSTMASQPLAGFVLDFAKAVGNNPEGAAAYFRLLNSPVFKLEYPVLDKKILAIPTDKYFTRRNQAQNAVALAVKAEKLKKGELLEAVDSILAEFDAVPVLQLDKYVELLIKAIDLVGDRKILGKQYKSELLSIEDLKLNVMTKDKLKSALKAKAADIMNITSAKVDKLEDFIAFVENVINDETVIVRSSNKHGLRFCSVTELTGEHVPYVYVLGNREDEFPVPAKRRWLYTEEDRELLSDLGIKLLTKNADYYHDCFFFAQTIFCATDKLYLSWYRDEGVSEEEPEANSSIFVDYVKQYFDDVKHIAVKHAKCASESEKLIAELPDETTKDEYSYTGADFAEALKEPVWNKIVGKKFSASSLETYKKCPLRYLAQKVWNADQTDLMTDEPSVKHKGTFIHDVLENFIKDNILPEKKQIKSEDKDILIRELENVFDRKAEEYEEKGYFGGPVWEVTKNEYKELCYRWLDYEMNRDESLKNFRPGAMEWEFGFGKNASYDIELQPVYENETKESLVAKFCGKVDRFDINASENEIYITDYKTGTAPGSDDIQIPLYILAVNELYKELGEAVQVKGGSYLELKTEPKQCAPCSIPFNVSKKTNKISQSSDPKTVRQLSKEESLIYLKNIIIDLVNQMHCGNFAIPKDIAAKSCKYCVMEKYCNSKKEDKHE